MLAGCSYEARLQDSKIPNTHTCLALSQALEDMLAMSSPASLSQPSVDGKSQTTDTAGQVPKPITICQRRYQEISITMEMNTVHLDPHGPGGNFNFKIISQGLDLNGRVCGRL